MAGIIFNNYITSKIAYERNPNFSKKNRLTIYPSYICEIIENELEANVKLTAVVLAEKDQNQPFCMEVEIVGFFEYVPEESEDISFKDYLMTNAIAILFPYLRTIIADITTRSNEFPTLTLPVANISKLLSEQDAIRYIQIPKADGKNGKNDTAIAD